MQWQIGSACAGALGGRRVGLVLQLVLLGHVSQPVCGAAGWVWCSEAGIGHSVSHPEVRCSVLIPTMDRSVGNGRGLEDHCAISKNFYIYCPTIPHLAGSSSDSVCRDASHIQCKVQMRNFRG